MRRPFILVPALFGLAALVGCEDGPNDTYQPAPEGASGVWNGQNPDAAVTPGSQGYDAGYPTSNAASLCSTDFKRERWSWMLEQPIKPPRMYAGIDLAKNDQWDGLTIEEAETPPADPNSPTGGLCQSIPYGFEGSCPSGLGSCNGAGWDGRTTSVATGPAITARAAARVNMGGLLAGGSEGLAVRIGAPDAPAFEGR